MNRSTLVKMFAVAVLTGILLLALLFVNLTIGERDTYRKEAATSIAQSYAAAQTVVGPVLVQPYTRQVESTEVGDKGKISVQTVVKQDSYLIFPKTLHVRGDLKPSERHHGLYKVSVYEFEGALEGDFDMPPGTITGASYGEPYITFAITDARGIVGTPILTANGQNIPMVQARHAHLAASKDGTEIAPAKLANGTIALVAPMHGATGGAAGRVHFVLNLNLAGTETFRIAPLADSNEITLHSSWRSPLFAGSFLPHTRRIGKDGFDATWQVSSLAASTQQQVQDDLKDVLEVQLIHPSDPYKLSDRATKYGVLFIFLTFGGFFIFEMVKRLPIHPVQYLLVGFALVLFFLLLISFSEHMPFGLAYLIASAACIGLLTFYLNFVLRSLQRGLAFGSMLTALYGCIYGLLLSEDNALLLGSVMLFAILAAIMVATRHVDWYRTTEPAPAPASEPGTTTASWLGGAKTKT